MSNRTQKGAKAKTGSGPRVSSVFSLLGWTLIFISVVLSLVLLVLSESKTKKPVEANCSNPVSKSEIFNCNITELEYVVEPDQQAVGLSGRDNLPENSGMVFVFDYPSNLCMWMKDMKISLDMVWLDKNKKIVKILKDVRPDTYPTSFCAPDTLYVLEVSSGVIDRLGLGVGDSIQL